MNKTWKLIIPVMLSGGLMACSTTGQTPVEPEQKPQVEEPKVEQPQVEEKEVAKETKPAEKPKQPEVVLKAQKNI